MIVATKPPKNGNPGIVPPWLLNGTADDIPVIPVPLPGPDVPEGDEAVEEL